MSRRGRAFGAVPRALREAVIARDGYRCAVCGCAELLQCDHVIPASRGGPTSLDNLRLLCQRHNLEAWQEHAARERAFGADATRCHRLMTCYGDYDVTTDIHGIIRFTDSGLRRHVGRRLEDVVAELTAKGHFRGVREAPHSNAGPGEPAVPDARA